MYCCSDGGEPAAPAPRAHSTSMLPLTTPRHTGDRPGGWPSRFATLIHWALPITTLALIPKCPGCIAAYILLFTGLGLSRHAAAATRWTLIALSITALAYALLRTARRMLAGPA